MIVLRVSPRLDYQSKYKHIFFFGTMVQNVVVRNLYFFLEAGFRKLKLNHNIQSLILYVEAL